MIRSKPLLTSVPIDFAYETIVRELDLIKSILSLLTRHDLLELSTVDFCDQSDLLLSHYMDLKEYSFTSLDTLRSLIHTIRFSQDLSVDFTYLKGFCLQFIQENKFAIGEIIIFGKFKSHVYQDHKANLKDNMIAFVRDFLDDSHFSIWYIEPKFNLLPKKHHFH